MIPSLDTVKQAHPEPSGTTIGCTRRAVRRDRRIACIGGGRKRLAAGVTTPAASRFLPPYGLLLEVGQLLQHLVRGRDDAGVGLEAALGDDQVGELLREVDVRHLESAAVESTHSALACDTDLCSAGVER